MKTTLIACLLAFALGWTVVIEYERATFLVSVNNAQASIDAIADAQNFAMPLIALSEQLARENAMFTQVIDRARDLVRTKETELVQTKEALNSSVELLQEQTVTNNECIAEILGLEDQIRTLCRTVDRLMAKIPDSKDREYLYDPRHNN